MTKTIADKVNELAGNTQYIDLKKYDFDKSDLRKKMYHRNHNLAFNNLIVFGYNPTQFMYMYSIDNKDYFKHIETRKYIDISFK